MRPRMPHVGRGGGDGRERVESIVNPLYLKGNERGKRD